MARRRKSRFGAVTGRRPGSGGRMKTFNVSVRVMRAHGKAFYFADACPKGRKFGGARCASGGGRTATAAAGVALAKLGNKLK